MRAGKRGLMRLFKGLFRGSFGIALFKSLALGYDPFFYEEREFVILGIMQNKVNLNGKWLKSKEEIEGFIVEKISKNCVVLREIEGGNLKEICLIKKGKIL